jgi:anti-sigma factor RsiW
VARANGDLAEGGVIVLDIHVEPADMGEEEIQDLAVVGQLLARQYHLVRAPLVEHAQPSTSLSGSTQQAWVSQLPNRSTAASGLPSEPNGTAMVWVPLCRGSLRAAAPSARRQ